MKINWYRFTKDIVFQIATTIIAIVAIFITFKTSKMSLEENAKLKEYEITFNEKRKAYAEFMNLYTELFIKSTEGPKFDGRVPDKVFNSIIRLEYSYYSLAPFMDDEGKQKTWALIDKYEDFCLKLAKNGLSLEKKDVVKQQFYGFRNNFIDILHNKLINTKK